MRELNRQPDSWTSHQRIRVTIATKTLSVLLSVQCRLRSNVLILPPNLPIISSSDWLLSSPSLRFLELSLKLTHFSYYHPERKVPTGICPALGWSRCSFPGKKQTSWPVNNHPTVTYSGVQSQQCQCFLITTTITTATAYEHLLCIRYYVNHLLALFHLILLKV